jgi:HAMP domain-containing protein
MSDEFDPDKYLADSEDSGFDPDAYLAEEPSRQPNLVEEKESTNPITQLHNSMIGGAVGAGAGKAADLALRHGTDFGMSLVGQLDRGQIDTIAKNADTYRAAPKLEEMFEQYRQLAEDTKKGGIASAAKAREAIKTLPPVPVRNYVETIAQPAKNPKLSVEIAPDKGAQFLGSEIDAIKPQLLDDQDRIAQINDELRNPSVDEKQLVNQDFKQAKYENRLGQLGASPTANKKHPIQDAHDTKRDQRKLQRIDEKLKKAEETQSKSLEDLQKRKEDFVFNRKNRLEKNTAVRGVEDSSKADRLANRKDQLVFNKILDDQKTAEINAIKQREKMEKLLAEKAELQDRISGKLEKAQVAAEGQMSKLRRTPAPIIETDPDFFNNRSLGEGYATSLQDALTKVEGAEQVDPIRLDQIVQELREGNINYNQSGAVNNFNKELSAAVSGQIKEMSPEYRAGMEQAEQSFGTQKRFQNMGIKYDDDLNEVLLGDSAKAKINNALLFPENKLGEHEQVRKALDEAKAQGNLPADTDIDQLLKQHELGALKGEVGRLRQSRDLSSFELDALAKGDVRRAPGIASKLGGTKLQELYGLWRDSKVGNAVKGASKAGLPILGAIAGATSAANAAEQGDLSPLEATGAGIAEVVNPIPLTDAVEGAVQAKKTYEATGSAYEALKSGAKGFTSPAAAFAESLNEGGLERSNDARTRMEQQFKAADQFKAPKSHEEFKTFVEQKPEQIANLLEAFKADTSAQSFLAPLEKAMNSDERTRSAVLFGLYQQPAFRAALKAKSGE